MAFCPNCGAEAGGRFCAKCGAALPESAGSSSHPPALGGMTSNLAGVLCYSLGLLTGVLFLALPPHNQNPFVRFHAFQSIFLHFAFIGIWIVESILVSVLPWSMGAALSLMGALIALAGLAVWLFIMYKAWRGERYRLPLVGELASRQA